MSPWGVDPAVQARVPAVGFRTLADGAIQLGDWVLVGATPPAIIEKPVHGELRTVKEVHSGVLMRAPDGREWAGDCLFGGSGGGLWLEAHWSLECSFVGDGVTHRVALSGERGADLFEVRRLGGTVEASPGEGDSLAARGTMRAMTFYRRRKDKGFDPRTMDAVAAVSVTEPAALYVPGELDAGLRLDVMLAVGALVSLRAVTQIPILH